MYVAVAVVILILIALTALLAIGVMISAPGYSGPVSDHFDGTRFINGGGVKSKGGAELLKWMLNRKREPWRNDVTESFGKRPLGHFKGGIRVTFVNHSTFLIQVDGVNILTDPVWSKRASPFTWIGPKRKRPPGINFADLPRIHLVLLSHNHYDHLDLQTMRLVSGAHHPSIVVPLGVKKFLDDHSISGATEVDWWQRTQAGQLTVEAVPAQHFSGRGILDRDATLWCGFIIRTSAGTIYFSGDTGYNAMMFKDIHSKCGPIRLAFLPIGAYKPQWFMAPIHASPEEAVKIHRDVGSQTSIAMHFGTFPLADDSRDDPVRDLESAITRNDLKPGEFVALKEGEAIVLE